MIRFELVALFVANPFILIDEVLIIWVIAEECLLC